MQKFDQIKKRGCKKLSYNPQPITNEKLNSVITKAKEQFKKGEQLFGKNGAFLFMLDEFLNKALDAKMEDHLAENKGNGGKDRCNSSIEDVYPIAWLNAVHYQVNTNVSNNGC